MAKERKDPSPERAAAVAAEPASKPAKVTLDSLETAANKLEKMAGDEIHMLCSRSDAEKKLNEAIIKLMSVIKLFPDNVKQVPTSPEGISSYMSHVCNFANSADFRDVMTNLRVTLKFAMVLALKLRVNIFPRKGMTFALLRLFSKCDCFSLSYLF